MRGRCSRLVESHPVRTPGRSRSPRKRRTSYHTVSPNCRGVMSSPSGWGGQLVPIYASPSVHSIHIYSHAHRVHVTSGPAVFRRPAYSGCLCGVCICSSMHSVSAGSGSSAASRWSAPRHPTAGSSSLRYTSHRRLSMHYGVHDYISLVVSYGPSSYQSLTNGAWIYGYHTHTPVRRTVISCTPTNERRPGRHSRPSGCGWSDASATIWSPRRSSPSTKIGAGAGDSTHMVDRWTPRGLPPMSVRRVCALCGKECK